MLTLNEYECEALKANRFKNTSDLAAPLLGIFGETGSLLTGAKKRLREVGNQSVYKDAVTEELGDVLWYLTVMLNAAGLSIVDAVLTQNPESGVSALHHNTFIALDQNFSTAKAEDDINIILIALASAVGQLSSQFLPDRFQNNTDSLREHAHRVLTALSVVASVSQISMQTVAEKNLRKIFDRWPENRCFRERFDSVFHDDESFPDELEIEVFEKNVDEKIYVFQKCNGLFIGDRLTDNVIVQDDYRFHDVFHFAYAAILSWSPVLRRLLKRKRKSDSKIDEAEDGARAAIIEEGVVAWIFTQAKEVGFFDDVKRGDLPFGLLKQVRNFTQGYEVAESPLWQWEEAILQGYEAFRFLQEHRSARLKIDTVNHKLTFEKMS